MGTADDPLRIEVERRLNALADAFVVRPFEQLVRVGHVATSPCRVIQDRLAEPVAVLRSIIELALGPQRPARGEPTAESAAVQVSVPAVEPRSRSHAQDRPDLPVDEYESLAASQVVARLDGLTVDELERVRAFESSHRGRRTVLGKIDQLLATTR